MSRRRNRNKSSEVVDDNDWLMTYSDFITLLMTFFIVILATSQIDQGKFDDLKAGWSEYTQKDAVPPMKALLEALKESTEGKPITVSRVVDGVKVDFSSEALYEQGSATLSAQGIDMLNAFIVSLKGIDLSGREIVVEGHTDNIPIHNNQFASNWELSGARAIGVVKHFIALAVDKHKLSAIAYADTYPVTLDEAKKSLNRRVSIYIKRAKRTPPQENSQQDNSQVESKAVPDMQGNASAENQDS